MNSICIQILQKQIQLLFKHITVIEGETKLTVNKNYPR